MDAPSREGLKKYQQISKEFIVAIGASAGGLEAIHELFDYMPADSDLSFVIVQHLSPDYKSLMPELLAKHTRMQIFEAEDGMIIRENSIYLIPSKMIMTVKDRRLRLTEKERTHLPNTAIDIFFNSLAKEHGKCAIAIVLSGTGTDGTKGIEAVKNAGGIVIVQDPMTAKFNGMPNSAVQTGYADLILPPELMAEELLQYLNEAPLLKSFRETDKKDEVLLQKLLDIVKQITTYDFSHYKKPTIHRRLAKRMTLKNVRHLDNYIELLEKEPDEVKLLCKEFLIGVTRFFRDEESFEDFHNLVLTSILAGKKDSDTVKAWVVACSTGEEAYSFAILFYEQMLIQNKPDLQIKIFATDIDQEALESASRGIYSESSIKDISPERLQNYFRREGNNYKIIPEIRRMVVFANHDVLKDPPFSKLDFVSCRNMLIYMNPELQQKVLKTFHFSLNAGCFLMLGPSENIGILKDSMEEISKKWKIFKSINRARLLDHEPFFSTGETRFLSPSPKTKNALNNLSEIFRETVIEEYQFAGIYIDKEFEVKQAIGNFKSFLQFPEGKFNFNLLKLVSTDLSIALSGAVRKSIKGNEKVVLKRVRLNEKGASRFVSIIVKPFLQQTEYLQPFLFIVISEDPQQIKEAAVRSRTPGDESNAWIADLESELKETKENLQAAIEELETANEELQSSNEEMISANEELQSTNEELQSLNEELHTVNAEHQLKIRELIELNDDLNNYFQNSGIGQILIDSKMIIRKFTPSAKQVINVIETDIGRSITDISDNILNLNLAADVQSVLNGKKRIEKEVALREGTLYQMMISPYVRQDKSTDGVVVTFVNITEIKQLNNIIEGVFNSSLSAIMALKALRNSHNTIVDFEWLTANAATENLLQIKNISISGKKILKEFPEFKTVFLPKFTKVVETGESLHVEYFYETGQKWLEIVAVKMSDGLVVTFSDITDKKKSTDLLAQGFQDLQTTTNKLTASNYALEQSNYELMQFASVVSHDLKEPLRKIQTFGNLLQVKAVNKLVEDEKIYLEKMINSSQRMQSLIDDLLSFSKLSNKHVHFTETDMNSVLNRILDDLEVTIKEKEAEFHIDPLPIIEAIPGQIHQLFQNLISNALKFNESAKPVIYIHMQKLDRKEAKENNLNPATTLCFSVEDNGIGFEEKYKEKIFGVFQRLHSAANYQGTGIGLAICKKIIENHKGLIRADSQPGKGTKFVIALPVRHHIEK
ncbi:MAG TPA: chemotaxis protein CheB [Flavitalea sp.]|nr:chemotaxis protein CheB [Flavitalea sp.]